MNEKMPRRAQPDSGDERADDTRRKLLLAAIDVFGRLGFEGASTRMIASQAGANLQSIPYYFGGKEGLYVAAAEHIGASIKARVHPVAERARGELAASGQAPGASPEPARALLGQILGAMARLMLSEESATWARFMIREQMEPTPAFDSLYANVMEPVFGVLRALIGSLMEADPASEAVRLRTLATVGHVLVLRAARATLLRQLGWQRIGTQELATVDALIAQVVASIHCPRAATHGSRAEARASTQAIAPAATKPARARKRTP